MLEKMCSWFAMLRRGQWQQLSGPDLVALFCQLDKKRSWRVFSVLFFSSAGWAFDISWSKCSLCMCTSVCLSGYCVCLVINQGGKNRNCCMHAETCNLACTVLPTNPDRTPKTRSVLPTLCVKIACWKQWACIAIFSQLSLTANGMLVYFNFWQYTTFRPLILNVVDSLTTAALFDTRLAIYTVSQKKFPPLNSL